jgi:signal transduction histidine kinase
MASPGASSQNDVLAPALESLPLALVVFDRSIRTVYANQVARELLSDVNDLPAALSKLTVDGPFSDWQSQLQQVIQSRESISLDAVAAGNAQSPELFLHIRLDPLRTPATGEVIGGVLLAENVTTRISMERRLAVSERLAAVGKLAAKVAHELNNPLDGVLRYTNLALRRANAAATQPATEEQVGDPKIIEYLQNIESGIVRMRDIVSSLLDFARTAPASFQQATLNKIVEDAISAMEGKAHDVGVTVVCNFHQTDMPVVRGSSLFQIFCNLIKNAIDAMPEGGTLVITTKLMDADLVISFEDSGIGLPPDIERIFEPFFTTKPPGQGTGLGLAVCRELITKYSGTITAHRRDPAGTMMIVRFPLKCCAVAVGPAAPLAGPMNDE